MEENFETLNITQKERNSSIISEILTEANYLTILENINDLIIILDDKYIFQYINDIIASKFIGYHLTDLIGESFYNYIHPDDKYKAIEIFENKSEENSISVEIRLKHKKGSWIWFESRGIKYYDEKGNLKRLLNSKNITERKSIEERYRSLFDNSPNGILIINFNGHIVDANSTFEVLMGFDKNYLIGKPIDESKEIFPDEIKSFFKRIFKASFKGEFLEPIEMRILRKDGKFIWVMIQTSIVKISGKTLIQFIFQDISEKKKVELLETKFKDQLENKVNLRTRELNKALEEQKYYFDQIVKSSQFKTEFMSTMSHELRTPLNAIIGFTDLLLEGAYGPLNENQLEFIKDIKASAEHQFDMIKNILDINKIEAGQVILSIQKFSLNSIVNQIRSSMRPLYKNKDLKFKVKGLDTEKEICADPIRFKEILLNLISNAIKFTIKGKVSLKIQEKYDHWIFKVSDTGIGIARKDFDLIFKEFKRVDSSYVRSVPGTGLGLSLTKRLINLHGGEINFFSLEGAGTTFTFTIPKKLEDSIKLT